MALDHIVAATSGKNNKKNPKNPDLVSFAHAPGMYICGLPKEVVFLSQVKRILYNKMTQKGWI
jgi:hypothetical protein